MNVVVIGGLERMQDQYRRVLESHGNTMRYVAGDETGSRVDGHVESADIAMIVTAGMKHKVQERVRSVLRGGTLVVYVNTRSLTGFKKAANEMAATIKGGDM